MRALFDTNILIDYLKGHEQAFRELLRYSDLMTSRITLMEVLAGAHSLDEEQEARKLLGLFRIVEIGAEIAERAVILKRERRLRLPDAIVLASAHHWACPLITRNTGDFSPDWPEVRVPYQLP